MPPLLPLPQRTEHLLQHLTEPLLQAQHLTTTADLPFRLILQRQQVLTVDTEPLQHRNLRFPPLRATMVLLPPQPLLLLNLLLLNPVQLPIKQL